VSGEDKYPAHDLGVYRAALKAGDRSVRRAAIAALAHYPEGADILERYIRAHVDDDDASEAIGALRKYAHAADYEERLCRIRSQVLDSHGASGEAEQGPQRSIQFGPDGMKVVDTPAPPSKRVQLASELTRLLFARDPKKYAGEMIGAIQTRLETAGTQISFAETALDELLVVACLVDRQQLYPLVPALIEDLDAFFDDPRFKAYRALVLITGEAIPYSKDDDTADRHKAMARYRAIYQVKLAEAEAVRRQPRAGASWAAAIDRLLPDDTHCVLSLDVRQLIDSPVFRSHCRQCLDAALHDCARFQHLVDCFGMDPWRNIQRITVAEYSADEDTVIIVHGRFNPARFRAGCDKYIHAGHEDVEAIPLGGHCCWVFPAPTAPEHGSITFGATNNAQPGKLLAVRWKGENVPSPCDLLGTLFVAVVDRHTLVLSTSPQAVLHAWEQAGQTDLAHDGTTPERRGLIRGKPTLFLATRCNPAESSKPDGAGEKGEESCKIESLRGTIRVSSGLDARLTLVAESPVEARKIMTSMEDLATRAEGFMKLVSGNDQTPLGSLVKTFKTVRSGRRIKVEGHVDAQLLEELLGSVTVERAPAEDDKAADQ
jgi:hypothetical protein